MTGKRMATVKLLVLVALTTALTLLPYLAAYADPIPCPAAGC